MHTDRQNRIIDMVDKPYAKSIGTVAILLFRHRNFSLKRSTKPIVASSSSATLDPCKSIGQR